MTTLPGLPLPLDFAPMEAKLTEALPTDPGWRFEPKWDGFRCLAFRSGEAVDLRAKSGKPLARYFPDVAAMLQALPVDRFILDGELTIPVNGELSFDALQMRLHPAESRVRKLAAETPAVFVLFDCLMDAKCQSLADAALTKRRAALEAIFKRFKNPTHLRLSPGTEDVAEARAWLAQTGAALDGVVAKRLEGPYVSGERAMLKIKRLRTADCVVGGFRYETGGDQVGSLLLGLYNEEGKLDHVGFTSAISDAERPALTKKLEKLAGGPGFTGDAPGGPSRWSNGRSAEWTPLKPELVVEVRYDHVTGDRFRHGTTLLRWRPDKAPRQCTLAQLRAELASLLGQGLSPSPPGNDHSPGDFSERKETPHGAKAPATNPRPKVFQTQIGFYDSVVAVPSQAAALSAWGTRQNLFAEGQARPAEDPAAISAALEHPGTPLRRAAGSKQPFSLEPGLPEVPDLPRPKAGSAVKAAKRPKPSKPPPDRSALDAAQARLKAINDRRLAEEADFDRRRQALEAEDERSREAWAKARDEAERALEKARAAYRKAGG